MSSDRKPSGQSGAPKSGKTSVPAHSERLLDSLALIVESGKAKTTADLLRYAQQGGLNEGLEMLRELADRNVPVTLSLDALRAQVRIIAWQRGTGLVQACDGKTVALVMPLPPHVTAVFSHLGKLTYVVPDGHHVPPHLDDLGPGGPTVVVGSRAGSALAPSQDVLVFEVTKGPDGYLVDAGVSDVVDVRVLPPTTRLLVHLRSQSHPEDVPLALGGRTLEMM